MPKQRVSGKANGSLELLYWFDHQFQHGLTDNENGYPGEDGEHGGEPLKCKVRGHDVVPYFVYVANSVEDLLTHKDFRKFTAMRADNFLNR